MWMIILLPSLHFTLPHFLLGMMELLFAKKTDFFVRHFRSWFYLERTRCDTCLSYVKYVCHMCVRHIFLRVCVCVCRVWKLLLPFSRYSHFPLEQDKDNDEFVKTYGINLCVSMCRQLLQRGEQGFHFYTLNLEKSVMAVLKELG